MNSRLLTIGLIGVGALSAMEDFKPLPRFDGYVSVRALVASRALVNKGGVERWYEMGRAKGVVLTRVESAKSTLYVFFPGSNGHVFNANLLQRSEVFSSLESAVSFVRDKPDDVSLTVATNGLNDGLEHSPALSRTSVTSGFLDSETKAFEAALEAGRTSHPNTIR